MLDDSKRCDDFLIDVELWDNIVSKGKDSTTDLLFDGLQHGIRMSGGPSIAMMNLGQKNGMILTRCAFAVMVKFQNLSEVIEEMTMQIELELGDKISLESSLSGAEKGRSVFSVIRECAGFDKIIRIYQSATRMRKWFQMKKMSLGERNKASQGL